eukprot:CAMPEP_0172517112 /NCGR_PEP_ID=MMETSP1066-20121228/281845_1 /TAXON_ID=671091 /ORGANISM="Coscinodiscus wailesii, Strain CCMP2513" /LENGTH=178 /DNA_ID=CAMNT_0013298913 /DNA_START=297 /DNA_END=833 /DNA_ORIENTATION=+
MNESNDDDMSVLPDSKRLISESASIELPFSSQTAYDAFSDLPRQPSWSPWLRSVSYLPDDGDDDVGIPDSNGVGRRSRWILRVKGVTLGWRAVATALERPGVIRWESVSGVKNMGNVEITPLGDHKCVMTLKMSVVVPRALALVFRKSRRIGVIFREQFLMATLVRFRAVVLEDLEGR